MREPGSQWQQWKNYRHEGTLRRRQLSTSDCAPPTSRTTRLSHRAFVDRDTVGAGPPSRLPQNAGSERVGNALVMSKPSKSGGTPWADRLVAAFNAHDAAAVGEFLTDDALYTMWQGDSWVTFRGRADVVSAIDGFDKQLSSDFTLTITFAVMKRDGFAIEYDEVGTNDRGVEPSGRRFSLRNVIVGELRRGKISRLTDYSDVTAYRAQTS